MATACTNCGHELPRDDAQFCSSCGTLVPSHPFSAQSLSAANSAASSTSKETEKPALREQMVHWPGEKPASREQMTQQPRQRTTRRIASEDLSSSSIAWPAPITHVSVKDSLTQKDHQSAVSQEQQSVENSTTRAAPPERELHVKVWEQNNPPTPLPESTIELVKRDIEEAPTSPLEMPAQPDKENFSSEQERSTSQNDIEYLDTTPIPNYAQTQSFASSVSRSIHEDTPLTKLQAEPQQQSYAHTLAPDSGMSQQPIAVTQSPQYSTVQRNQASPKPSIQGKRVPTASTSSAFRPRKSPVPFIILLTLLGILVLGGGAWVLLAQPFNVPPVTQPLQDFSDTGLGVSLSYPTSWTVQHTPTSVLLADSSHTAQVKVQMAENTSDAATYVQQQAKKIGMAAVKPLGVISFAGLSWQQVQGNVQQDGANYTTTMLATTHGNRMYVLTQMAPQNVYADEESVVFSAIRNSVKFL